MSIGLAPTLPLAMNALAYQLKPVKIMLTSNIFANQLSLPQYFKSQQFMLSL